MERIFKKNKHFLTRFLPPRFKKRCLIGICNPVYTERQEKIYSIKNKKWSASPRDFFSQTKSIIVLIHFSSVNCDYKVEEIVLNFALRLWEKAGLKTHVINQFGKADASRLLGVEWGQAAKKYDCLLLLKDLAYYAGLGQFGKNALIINPHFGSDFKIQVLLTEEELEYGSPMIPARYACCHHCNLCLETCPAGAIGDYEIEPLKCQWNWDSSQIKKDIRPELVRLIGLKKPKADKDKFKIEACRNCQAFCKANSSHYFKARII